jgi:hypothetical protein
MSKNSKIAMGSGLIVGGLVAGMGAVMLAATALAIMGIVMILGGIGVVITA